MGENGHSAHSTHVPKWQMAGTKHHDPASYTCDGSSAYLQERGTLRGLDFIDRDDPTCDGLARRVIEVARVAPMDAAAISDLTLFSCDPRGAPKSFEADVGRLWLISLPEQGAK